jgi:3-oxoacyl-[acyl-carrier-protein] synthase II
VQLKQTPSAITYSMEGLLSDIVITGTAIICAAGHTPQDVLARMYSGRMPSIGGDEEAGGFGTKFPWPVAGLGAFDTRWPSHDPWWIDNQKFANLAARLAVTAANSAIARTGAADEKDAPRCGVVMAVGASEEDEASKSEQRLLALAQSDPRPLATFLYEEVADYTYVRSIPSQTGQFVAQAAGFRGSNVSVYGEGAAGGLGAVTLALRLLQTGELDRVMIVGVAPFLSPSMLVKYDQADPLGTEVAVGRGPFDKGRRGTFAASGAAAAVMLEHRHVAQRRGVEPLAELLGCEAICAPSRVEAIGAVVDMVMEQTEHAPGLWWAHGAGSVSGDLDECLAVGPRIRAPTTSSKGTIGNAFECAALVDVVLAVEALNQQCAPPIGLLRTPDPALGAIDFVVGGSPRPLRGVTTALVTTVGHINTTTAGAAIVAKKEQK